MWWDVSGMSIIIHSSLQGTWSSLMLACSKGHAEVVKILVSPMAHVNYQDKVSYQPSLMTLGDLYPDVRREGVGRPIGKVEGCGEWE